MDSADESAHHPNVYDRLAARGLDLNARERLKFILSTTASSRLRFAEVFGPRWTLKQAFRDYSNLKHSTDASRIVKEPLREQLQRQIDDAGYVIASALWEANRAAVGDWRLQWLSVPTRLARVPLWYIRPLIGLPASPGIRVIARHVRSHETREAFIPGRCLAHAERLVDTLERVYRQLGLWDDLYWGPPAKKLRSNRARHAWPVYTQHVIPRLYEFLTPYYRTRAHYSEKRDREALRPNRPALYAKHLFTDMLDLLRTESPHDFAFVTIETISSAVQQHLDRSAKLVKAHKVAKASKQ